MILFASLASQYAQGQGARAANPVSPAVFPGIQLLAPSLLALCGRHLTIDLLSFLVLVNYSYLSIK